MGQFTALKEEAWAANREIPRRSLALYTWGNASAFDASAGVFAIKPSGVEYDDLTPDDMVIVDLENRIVEGRLRPSSDTKTHAVLFSEFGKSGVRGVVHTHSTFAVAWAQACRSIPVLGTTHADHLTMDIPCTDYLGADEVLRDYETETGLLIVKTFQDMKLNPAQVPMVLVAGHGPFTWGTSAAKAVYHGAVLEEIARMAQLTLSIAPGIQGLPPHIVKKHFDRKHGSGAYYGQT